MVVKHLIISSCVLACWLTVLCCELRRRRNGDEMNAILRRAEQRSSTAGWSTNCGWIVKIEEEEAVTTTTAPAAAAGCVIAPKEPIRWMDG